jgi:hypothetical protein
LDLRRPQVAGDFQFTITGDHTPRSTTSPRWRSSSTTFTGKQS